MNPGYSTLYVNLGRLVAAVFIVLVAAYLAGVVEIDVMVELM